jgi:ABC-type uncharacterized transport system substrate-binding protein
MVMVHVANLKHRCLHVVRIRITHCIVCFNLPVFLEKSVCFWHDCWFFLFLSLEGTIFSIGESAHNRAGAAWICEDTAKRVTTGTIIDMRSGFIVWMCAICVFPASPVCHPHMFIDTGVKFVLNDNGLKGIHITWEMDEMNSAWIIEDFDKNGNMKFENREQQTIYSQAFSAASQDNYFINLFQKNRKIDTLSIERFSVSLNDLMRVVYSFYVPVSICAGSEKPEKILLYFRDPTIYIAFSVYRKSVTISEAERIDADVGFIKVDYADAVVLKLKRK